MAGTFFAEQAAAFLKKAGRERPFFLITSFNEPHSPFRFPVEFAGRHDPASFEMPPVISADELQIPEIFRHLSDEDKRGIIASYYTSVEFLDKNVGIVLDALKESGHADDTLVIYIGDHGYMLGQHGRFEKHCSFEPAVRAPLIMRLPGVVPAESHTSALVEFIDIVPTVLEICQVAAPPTVQGKSLVPLLTGKADRHRDHVVVEYSENEEAMIRDERWKLIYTTGKRNRDDGYATGLPLPGRTIRIYDTKNDPDELHDLSEDPAQRERIAQLINGMVDHMVATAREPEILPKDVERLELLDFCLQPRDVGGGAKRVGHGSP
jgi:choline-sulfatase